MEMKPQTNTKPNPSIAKRWNHAINHDNMPKDMAEGLAIELSNYLTRNISHLLDELLAPESVVSRNDLIGFIQHEIDMALDEFLSNAFHYYNQRRKT